MRILRLFVRHVAPTRVKFETINVPQGAYPLRNSFEIFRMLGQFHGQSTYWIWCNSLLGFWSYKGLTLGVHFFSEIFSTPSDPKTVLRCKNCTDLLYHILYFAYGGTQTSRAIEVEGRKSAVFLSVALLNGKLCERKIAINATGWLHYGMKLKV